MNPPFFAVLLHFWQSLLKIHKWFSQKEKEWKESTQEKKGG